MKNFKRNSLYLALMSSMGISSIAIAQNHNSAMFLSPDGTGQVLLYPYYSVRGGLNTYLSVVNTTSHAKAVKVRFLESKNSREVLDFNLYLSPKDVWTGAVVNDSNGAKLITADKSCTVPSISSGGAPFKNEAYVEGTEIDINNESNPSSVIWAPGVNIKGTDGESTSLDRTREGYIEVIEMGEIHEGEAGTDPRAFYEAIVHTDGIPGNCSKLATLTQENYQAKIEISAPTGGLIGSASLINPDNGTQYGYDPVVIDSFADGGGDIWHQQDGTLVPDLRDGRNYSATFYNTEAVVTYWPDAPQGLPSFNQPFPGLGSVYAVNALLMHSAVINEYVLDSITLSDSAFVVTFPTKRYMVPVKNEMNPTHLIRGAMSPFTSTFWEGGACEMVSMEAHDREERGRSIVITSPAGVRELCWEANVITFVNNPETPGNEILQSSHAKRVTLPGNFENGWVRIDLSGSDSSDQSVDPRRKQVGLGEDMQHEHTYFGLPVIGFMVHDFINENASPGVMATYGGNFNHKYESCVQSSADDTNIMCHLVEYK